MAQDHGPEHWMLTSKEEFLRAVSTTGSVPPLYAEIPHAASPAALYPSVSGPGSFVLESVKGPRNIARYSFIGFEPYMTFKAKGDMVEVETGGKRALSSKKPLLKLKELLSLYSQSPVEGLPPFQGGAAGLFCYDFVRYFEDLPDTTANDLRIPEAHFVFTDRLIAFDHVLKKAWAIVCPGLRDMGPGHFNVKAINWGEKYDEAKDLLARITNNLLPVSERPPQGPGMPVNIVHECSERQYTDMVRRAKEYIRAGDIFQANLSLRVSAFIGETSPWDLYLTLRNINPSPFACFLDFGDYQIVSSSPERLVMVKDGLIQTRPIAGTRPRGRDIAEDESLRAELLLNEKERAEHIMLIDLERNDIGKVSDYGSVLVDEFMITEDYSHVIHIVSNVRGDLAPGKTMFEAIRATLPGGTITGVPKVRCMEIIDELEPLRRGPYTGSAGYLGFSGNADFNIIIRTFVIKDKSAYVQAGAGIVADSDPAMEYREALKKAEALLKTLSLCGVKGA